VNNEAIKLQSILVPFNIPQKPYRPLSFCPMHINEDHNDDIFCDTVEDTNDDTFCPQDYDIDWTRHRVRFSLNDDIHPLPEGLCFFTPLIIPQKVVTFRGGSKRYEVFGLAIVASKAVPGTYERFGLITAQIALNRIDKFLEREARERVEFVLI
jgi:hypothetical protein